MQVVSEGNEGIALALRLIWPNAPGGKATHYRIANYTSTTEYYQNKDGQTTGHSEKMVEDQSKGVPTLILFWHEERGNVPLPFPLGLDETIQFVQNWLKVTDMPGRPPDHDGNNGMGWCIFTEGWGHVAGSHYAIVAIQPAWAMYGK